MDRKQATENIYQEGVRSRASGVSKCPYPVGSHQEYYWRRGYRDAENPPPEGTVYPLAVAVTKAQTLSPKDMEPQVSLQTPDGQPLYRLYIASDKCRLTTDEMEDLARHLERVLTENPYEFPMRVIDRGRDFYLRGTESGSGASTGRTPRAARVVDGVVRVPVGATLTAEGEILVPARSLDGSSPNAKSFRRACRAARNAIREIAEKDGRPVSVVTQEMMEKSR